MSVVGLTQKSTMLPVGWVPAAFPVDVRVAHLNCYFRQSVLNQVLCFGRGMEPFF